MWLEMYITVWIGSYSLQRSKYHTQQTNSHLDYKHELDCSTWELACCVWQTIKTGWRFMATFCPVVVTKLGILQLSNMLDFPAISSICPDGIKSVTK